MSTADKRDFVSALPPELLSEIFQHAWKDTKPPPSPISRAFLPLQRLALFRQIRIDSLSQFFQLVGAHEANSGLGGMVKELEMWKVDNAGGREAVKKNERRIKSFFSKLVNLEQLKIGSESTSLLNLVLSLRIARSELRRLSSLILSTPPQWKRPFDSKFYGYLNSYPSLRCLELKTLLRNESLGNPRGGPKLTKITELVLRTPDVDRPATLDFLESFPNLTSLTLDVLHSNDPDFTRLARTLPTNLTSLTFRNFGFYDGYSMPFDHNLPRLVNLEYLYLSEGNFSQELPKYLRQLSKLKTLGFGRGALLSCSRLEELILGPNRIPTLEKVIFDQVEGKIGWSIISDSDGLTLHPDWKESKWYGGPGWIVPQWTSFEGGSFYEGDAKTLVDRIKLSSVQFEGTTLSAFGIFDVWGPESTTCIIARAYLLGDFEECREVFGDKFVDEELLFISADEAYPQEADEEYPEEAFE
ncbi:hypothetical protein JCM3765_001677 [Sporobolomyces pararoseus]